MRAKNLCLGPGMLGTYVGLGFMFVALVIAVVMRIKRPHAAIVQMKAEDGDDPLKRWARGCYAILFGQASPDRRGSSFCVAALAHSWEIHTGDEAMATIQRLCSVPSGRVAWDLVRVVVVARLAAGAGFIGRDQAQAAVGRIQGELRAKYPGWEEMASDYDAVVHEKGFGDSHLEGRPAAREVWKVVPFK